MRVRGIGCGLLLLSGIVAGRGLLACGDKYFVTVQGTRYLLASMTSDSNILIYNRPGSEVTKLFAGIPVEKTLTKTGFLTTVVTNESDLKSELAKGGSGNYYGRRCRCRKDAFRNACRYQAGRSSSCR